MTTRRVGRARIAMFLTVVLLAIGIGVGYVAKTVTRMRADARPTAATATYGALEVSNVTDEPHVVFRSTALGPTYGRVAVTPLRHPDGPRAVTSTECERVYSVGRVGMCLSSKRGLTTTYAAHLLDPRLRPSRKLESVGLPSRARVSSDGRLAATTTFVSGHSYAQTGFSTVTTIYEIASGTAVHNLEDFRVIREGKRYRSADVNVWGVTFSPDGDTFYATVASKGVTYLARGQLRARTLRTLRRNVECPSLSPDGARIAYKKRSETSTHLRWRLHVLDLASGKEVVVAEKRSVDDQVEWLDDGRLMYGLPRSQSAETDVWVVPADGSGAPRLFIPRAWSPAVVR